MHMRSQKGLCTTNAKAFSYTLHILYTFFCLAVRGHGRKDQLWWGLSTGRRGLRPFADDLPWIGPLAERCQISNRIPKSKYTSNYALWIVMYTSVVLRRTRWCCGRDTHWSTCKERVTRTASRCWRSHSWMDSEGFWRIPNVPGWNVLFILYKIIQVSISIKNKKMCIYILYIYIIYGYILYIILI